MASPQRNAGPTRERLKHSDGLFEIGGDNRSGYRFTMGDTPLGRALVRQKLSEAEYTALKKYALHWFAGGLQGHLNSVDLNRVLAFDPGSMTGLARSEAAADHRARYQDAARYIGTVRAFVSDHVACYEMPLEPVGKALGYRSPFRARSKALEILRDAGDCLAYFWTRQR